MKKLLSGLTVVVFGLLFLSNFLADAGEKKTEKVVKIKGMVCTACEAKVQKALLKVEGVKSATVDHKTGEAKVVFVSDKVDLKKINTAVTEAGFTPISYDGKTACEAGACDCCTEKKTTEAEKTKKGDIK